MAETKHVAVIDIGKTNAKVVLFDLLRQQEIQHHTTPNTVLPGPPYPHYNIEALWSFILNSLKSLSQTRQIDAISITTHGASAALLDADGALALPVLDYEHDGPNATSQQYEALRPSFSETGSPRLPNGLNLGAQVFWQHKQFPEDFGKVASIVTYPQYWAFRLSGVLANEATSLGCHTDLWAPSTGDYASLVDRQNWRRLMPPLRRASDALGCITAEVVAATGLSARTKVHCGIHDSNASLLPHLINHKPPFAVVSTGTWVICMAMGAKPVALDPARDTLINVNALGQPVPSARFMGGREYELLGFSAQHPAGAKDGEYVIAQEVMLLPSVVPGCGPFPQAKARWINSEGLSLGQCQAAASFYLAMMTATCLDLVGAQGDVIVEGPLGVNLAYVQMLASALGRNVIAQAASTGTAFGAALLCAGEGSQDTGLKSITPPQPRMHDYAQSWRGIRKS